MVAACTLLFVGSLVDDDREADAEADPSEALQKALLNMLGKPTHELVKVDLAAKLEALGLDRHFPHEMWPDVPAVRELATKIRARKKSGELAPFVFADLKKFLPAFCPEFVKVKITDTMQLGEEAQPKEAKWRLEVTQWLWAWDAYALGAAAVGQACFLIFLLCFIVSLPLLR